MASLRLASRRLPSLSSASSRTYATRVSSPPSGLRTAAYATVFTVSAGLFAVYYFDSRAAIHRYFLTPALRNALDAETGHRLAVRCIGAGLSPKDKHEDGSLLKAELWGTELSNPIGLAAGFDKDGEAIDGLFDLGFSWVEIGSVTPKPQPGNPSPRVFRLPEDSGLINRYGFPSLGHTTLLSRLRARLPTFTSPDSDASNTPASLYPHKFLAINLGKNKTSPLESPDDFVSGVKAFAPYADALVVNVSSPNTPGLRGMQQKEVLENLLSSVTKARDEVSTTLTKTQKPKLLLKIAPDLTSQQIQDIADAVINAGGIDGVIVSNTTIARPASLRSSNKSETGGLSGAPLLPLSLSAVRSLRTLLPASIPIIGCGGISSGSDALAFARAGASFVQVYTSFGYDGAGACRRIKDELDEALRKEEGGKSWAEVVKKAVNELSLKEGETVKGKGKEIEGVGMLIEQAKELQGLLDRLGERMDKEDTEAVRLTEVGAAVVSVI